MAAAGLAIDPFAVTRYVSTCGRFGAAGAWGQCAPAALVRRGRPAPQRSEEHTSELQSHSDLVCRLLLEKKKTKTAYTHIIDEVVFSASVLQRLSCNHS